VFKQAQRLVKRNYVSILTKIVCDMLPVRDISSFKRSFYSVLDSECSASPFQSGNKPRRSQNPTVRQILTEIDCNFQLVGDISSFKRSFYSSLHAGCSVSPFHIGNKPRRSQKPFVRQILTTIDCDFQLVGDISSFKRSFYPILLEEHSARCRKR
jgi:hypothetical protein